MKKDIDLKVIFNELIEKGCNLNRFNKNGEVITVILDTINNKEVILSEDKVQALYDKYINIITPYAFLDWLLVEICTSEKRNN